MKISMLQEVSNRGLSQEETVQIKYLFGKPDIRPFRGKFAWFGPNIHGQGQTRPRPAAEVSGARMRLRVPVGIAASPILDYRGA